MTFIASVSRGEWKSPKGCVVVDYAYKNLVVCVFRMNDTTHSYELDYHHKEDISGFSSEDDASRAVWSWMSATSEITHNFRDNDNLIIEPTHMATDLMKMIQHTVMIWWTQSDPKRRVFVQNAMVLYKVTLRGKDDICPLVENRKTCDKKKWSIMMAEQYIKRFFPSHEKNFRAIKKKDDTADAILHALYFLAKEDHHDPNTVYEYISMDHKPLCHKFKEWPSKGIPVPTLFDLTE